VALAEVAPAFGLRLGLAVAIGLVLLAAWIIPAEAFAQRGSAPATLHLARAGWAAVLLVAASSAAELALRSLAMTGTPQNEVLQSMATVLRSTHYGRVVQVRAPTLLALFALPWAVRGRRRLALPAAALLVFAWTLSASGHAAAHGDTDLREWVDVLHVLAGSAWAGSMIAYAAAVARAAEQVGWRDPPWVLGVTRRLSRAAALAVLGVLSTGVLRICIEHPELASPGAWRPFPAWTGVLAAKLALFAAWLGLGFWNHTVNLPRLARWSRNGSSAGRSGCPGALAALHTGVRLEAALAVVVLAVSSALTQLPPPR